MTTLRRSVLALALLPALLIVAAVPAASAEGTTGDDNTAVAVNTEDGASVFRLAFSIRRVANGVIDETNSAYALASCTDCQTVALAFQIVLALGDVDIAVPHNQAVAYNEQCAECVTYASATQIVLGFDRPTHFTAEGRQRLTALYQTLRSLEERAPTMSVTELNAAVQAAKTELVAILEQELVEVPAPAADTGDIGPESSDAGAGSDGAGATTTTTATPSSSTSSSSTTTTTVDEPESTTTTTDPQAATTTSTANATGGS